MAQKLKEAQGENDKPIPEEIIASVQVPSTESIHFHKTTTACPGLAKKLGTSKTNIQQIVDKDENGLPLFIYFEHIPTSFVHLDLALGTASLPTELKPLLGVYLINFFATPIMKGGKRIEFEEIITKLEQDTIGYSINRGTDIGHSEMIYVPFIAEADKFETVVLWLRSMLVDSVFDTERIISAVKKMLADVPEEKRDGKSMSVVVDDMIHYDAASAVRATGTLVKGLYLQRILEVLETEPQQVLDKLKALRKHLLTFANMRILVIANLETLPNPVSTFKHLTDTFKPGLKPTVNPIDDRNALLSDIGRNPGGTHYLTPMPIDSSFAVLTSKGPEGYKNAQRPLLMVALAYLNAKEGPMWKSIRGPGHAYGSNFSHDPETGLLRFHISKSSSLFAAYESAKTVVKDLAGGMQKIEQPVLKGALSSIVHDFANKRATVINAATHSFVDHATHNVGKGYQDWALREARKVTEEDVKNILNEVVAGVFVPEKTDLVVTCGSIMRHVSSSLSTSSSCSETPLTFPYRALTKTLMTQASKSRSSS
jgi:Zn-dependent M16 (insulinase) family peptidase